MNHAANPHDDSEAAAHASGEHKATRPSHNSISSPSPKFESWFEGGPSPAFYKTMYRRAQRLDVPFSPPRQLEAFCLSEQADEPVWLTQCRTLTLITEQLHQYYMAHNQRRRQQANEVLDGRVGHDDDAAEVVTAFAMPSRLKASSPVRHNVSMSPEQESDMRTILADYTRNPPRAIPLKAPDGRGLEYVETDGIAVTITLRVVDDVIVDAGFHAFGPPHIGGCTSFMLDVVVGQTPNWARCLRADALAYVLRLERPEKVCALRAVAALRRALRDLPVRKEGKGPGTRGGAPQGPRKVVADGLPSLTACERVLLQPGETYVELMRERGMIVGVMQNFQECIAAAETLPISRHDESAPREMLRCMVMSIQAALEKLPEDDSRLVERIGIVGTSGTELAQDANISRTAINKRLWSIARRVQKIWRLDGSTSKPKLF